MKKLLPVAMAVLISGGLAGCYVEDDTPDGGGGGPAVIERDRERTIERDSQPDVNIQHPPAPAPDVNIRHEEKHETKTTTP